MRRFKAVLVAAIAASSLLPATTMAKRAEGKQAEEKRNPKIVVHPRQRQKGYGFLPGYRQPPYQAEWRDRSVRHGVGYPPPYELRFLSDDGELRYGWGYPGTFRGRWNGGSFGPCWKSTPIGLMWTCGR
jgi:hypothetical protein